MLHFELALILLLVLFRCYVWQGGGGAIYHENGGTMVITGSKFVNNTATSVSDGLCT